MDGKGDGRKFNRANEILRKLIGIAQMLGWLSTLYIVIIITYDKAKIIESDFCPGKTK
jgi:hypothetical protein